MENTQKRTINGHVIPSDLPLSELLKMLESKNMMDFVLTCETLADHKTDDAYIHLKRHLDDPDKYRRRYVWSIIFEFSQATELTDRFVENFYSDDSIFVILAFDSALKYRIPLSETVIWDAVERNGKIMWEGHYDILMRLSHSSSNFDKLMNLYRVRRNSRSVREHIARVLAQYAEGEYFDDLYELFKNDEYSKVRRVACDIAIRNKRKDLLEVFKTDPDGHIRKAAERYLALLENNIPVQKGMML